MQHDELVIRILQNGEIIVEDTENGVKGHKKVSPGAFMECIRSSIKSITVSSGIMPLGTFYYAEGQNKKICIEFPSRRSDIIYESTEYKNFPLPRLVFGFRLAGEYISNVQLGVADTGMITPKTKMYVYPFSNVYGFNLCCGANRLPRIKSLHQLTGVMHYIMSMPNNNDHYDTGNTQLDVQLRQLFETLKDKTPEFYYTDVLYESEKTLQDFVNA